MRGRGVRRRGPAIFVACAIAGALAVGAGFSQTNATVVGAEHYVAPMMPSHQNTPALAFDGTNHFVVWGDLRSGPSDVFGARVNQQGTGLDGTGIPISTLAEAQEQPAIAFDGTDYFVAWADRRAGSCGELYASRVSQSGTVVDGTGKLISTPPCGANDPALAFDGTNYLVVWRHDTSIVATRVTRSGEVLDPAGIVLATTVLDAAPSVAFDGSGYLVVWHDHRNGCCDVYGGRVSTSGLALDPVGGFLISDAPNHQKWPVLAFDGTNYLVAWQDRRFTLRSDIYGARISPAGTVIDPAAFLVGAGQDEQTLPAIAFSGGYYFVVWQDSRSRTNYDIYGTRVSTAGVSLDTPNLAISTNPKDEVHPALAGELLAGSLSSTAAARRSRTRPASGALCCASSTTTRRHRPRRLHRLHRPRHLHHRRLHRRHRRPGRLHLHRRPRRPGRLRPRLGRLRRLRRGCASCRGSSAYDWRRRGRGSSGPTAASGASGRRIRGVRFAAVSSRRARAQASGGRVAPGSISWSVAARTSPAG
jgi:hypothetical protein